MHRLTLTITFLFLSGASAFAANGSTQDFSDDQNWKTALLIAIGGGVVGGSGLEIFRWLRRPKLFVDYERRNNGVAEKEWTKQYKPDGEVHIYEQVFALLRISNRGFKVAINCRAYLTGIDKIENGQVAPTRYANSVQLSWPGFEFDPRTVYPGVPIYVELVSIDKKKPQWQFQARGFTKPQLDLKDYHGTFRLTVVAVADNAAPCFVKADVSFLGTPESLRILSVSPLARTTRELIFG